jgi:hypothetical protein
MRTQDLRAQQAGKRAVRNDEAEAAIGRVEEPLRDRLPLGFVRVE